jgi:phosphoribosylformylglycinamidine cyclo-ligase
MDELSKPHLSYLGAFRAARGAGDLRGAAHITGGGLPANLPRALGEGQGAEIDRNAWDVPPVFRKLAALAGWDWDRAADEFNLGIGFVLVVSPGSADAVAESVQGATGEPVVDLGHVTADRGVTWRGRATIP